MKSNSVSKRSGILAGGNWIIDRVKIVDAYPGLEQLANIKSQHQGTGGSPYNVLLDLAKLGVEFPLLGTGLVGKDALGASILEDCAKHKIDTRYLKATADADTSYTDVFTVQSNGKRTFFHYRGANALWDGKELDFSKIKARIFHLGYLLLLDKMDVVAKDGTTAAAKLLAAAQAAGMKTSIDVVSETGDRFKTVVTPALKHCDYAIINEYEAGMGAGDAFAAGVLLGLHEGWDLQKSLLTGVCAAAASLSDPTCTGGMKPLAQVEALKKKYGVRPPLEPGED